MCFLFTHQSPSKGLLNKRNPIPRTKPQAQPPSLLPHRGPIPPFVDDASLPLGRGEERADVLAVEGVELRSANAVLEENNRELAAGRD